MTEIIDGVDVSGCEYVNCCCYENGKCLWTKRYYENNIVPDCEKVKDCYYKQRKRLEAENAKLKEMLSKEPKSMQAFQIAYSGLKKDNEVLWGMVKDYKMALEEIKKISKLAFAICDDDCGNANKFMDIINKVSEVLKDE